MIDMGKVAVVYWSGTGNTEAMAEYVAEGAKSKGYAVDVITAGNFSSSKLGQYDAIAFGCPSMGEEILEEDVFQPMFDEVKGALSGKRIALFGSYGWGDGEWMENWEAECRSLGAQICHDSVICHEVPGTEAAESCRSMGASLV